MAAVATLGDFYVTSGTSTQYSKTCVVPLPGPDRIVVVTIAGRSGGTPTVSSVTVGDVNAAALTSVSASGNSSSAFWALVPDGEELDVVIKFTGSLVRGGFQLHVVRGAQTPPVGVSGNTQFNMISYEATGPGVAVGGAFATGDGGQRPTSAVARFVAGTVQGRCRSVSNAAGWQGIFTDADVDSATITTTANPSLTSMALFYDAAIITTRRPPRYARFF